MKYILKLTTILALAALLGGCAGVSAKTGDQSKPTDKPVSDVIAKPGKDNQGITVNKISFEELSEENIPEFLKDKVESSKTQRGYIYEEKDGYFYIVIFSGEKSTGGYSIKVISIEDNEGKTNIMVEETSPNKGDMVTQAITYPYTAIKVTGITPNINIFNKDGSASNYPLLESK
jgi:hypothetical protein